MLHLFIQKETVSVVLVPCVAPEGKLLIILLLSGSLPAGLSLNTSTGIISGTASAVDADTQSSFTIRATDLQSQTADRAFTITIKNQTVASSLVFKDKPAGKEPD